MRKTDIHHFRRRFPGWIGVLVLTGWLWRAGMNKISPRKLEDC